MEVAIICLTAFVAAVLTFFSGFGLGTLLTPVMALFFPIEVAIGLTGVVHFCNNIFKIAIVGRHADKAVLIKFGIPAVIAAIAGAWLLLMVSDLSPLFSYTLKGEVYQVYPVKFIIALLLITFAVIEMLPRFRNLQFSQNKLPLGGILSGFFGGLAGVQGALRAAFLIRAGLTKEAFIGTAVVVSTFVDFTRLGVYASRFGALDIEENAVLIIAAVGSAIAGAWMGNRMLKKVTLDMVQKVVAVMLILISLGLALGWV